MRLQPSLLEEARKAAEAEGVALNQLINVAVAEKISALRTLEYFAERAKRADRKETLRILDRAGQDNLPMPGDELGEDQSQPGNVKKASRRVGSGALPGGKRLTKKTRGT
ncbi:MAG TPA: hypothetical protein VNB54_03650 [Alphaproteobacteria bacterium]|nr:hypothetical protein [Alphaproteobacteria bacterium]